MSSKTCPQCGVTANGDDEIEEKFGYRTAAIQPQSWCRLCRNKKKEKPVSEDDRKFEEFVSEHKGGKPPEQRLALSESFIEECVVDRRYEVLIEAGYSFGEIEALGKKYLAKSLDRVLKSPAPCTKCGKSEQDGAQFTMCKYRDGSPRRHPWCKECKNTDRKARYLAKKKEQANGPTD